MQDATRYANGARSQQYRVNGIREFQSNGLEIASTQDRHGQVAGAVEVERVGTGSRFDVEADADPLYSSDQPIVNG